MHSTPLLDLRDTQHISVSKKIVMFTVYKKAPQGTFEYNDAVAGVGVPSSAARTQVNWLSHGLWQLGFNIFYRGKVNSGYKRLLYP